MAQLKKGLIVSSIKGKLAGHSLQESDGSLIAKTNPGQKKVKPSSLKLAQARTSHLMTLWSKLTNKQRVLWTNQSSDYLRKNSFGDLMSLNGFWLFQLINQNRLLSNQVEILDPGPVHVPTYPTELTIEATQSTLTLQSDKYQSSDKIIVFATMPLSAGISKPKRYLRYVTTVTAVQLTSGVDIYGIYAEKFGNLAENQTIFIGQKVVSNVSGYSNRAVLTQKIQVMESYLKVKSVDFSSFTIVGGSALVASVQATGNKKIMLMGVYIFANNIGAKVGVTTLDVRWSGDSVNQIPLNAFAAATTDSVVFAGAASARFIDVSGRDLEVRFVNATPQTVNGEFTIRILYQEKV